jgi:hypothetical protein
MKFRTSILLLFLRITRYNVDPYNTHAHSSLNTSTQTLPYEHLRRIEPTDFGIHEVTTGAFYEHLRWTEPVDLEIQVTTGASLSTRTSPTNESIAPLNPEINLRKCEHPY